MKRSPSFFSSLWNGILPILILLLCCISTENGLSFRKLICFTQSTLLFISCNCSQPWLPGETWCWNREAVSKKYKLLNHAWLCGSKRRSLWRVGAAMARRSGAGAGSPTLACWLFCRSALSTLVMTGSSCKLSIVQHSQYVPDDEYDADLLEEKYISEEKNNYFSKQDNEAEPMLHGHKIDQNFWATALTSNKSLTWRSFCRVNLNVSDPKYFPSYIKLKNY